MNQADQREVGRGTNFNFVSVHQCFSLYFTLKMNSDWYQEAPNQNQAL